MLLKDSIHDLVCSKEALKLLSFEIVTKYHVIPFSIKDDTVTLIVDDNFNGDTREILEFILSKSIQTIEIDTFLIQKLITHYYGKYNRSGVLIPKSNDLCNDNNNLTLTEEEIKIIINNAIAKGASDIHWELHSNGNELIVRYRIDGELVNSINKYDSKLSIKIISCIKLLAHMNIDQKRLPQDGRMHWDYNNKRYDLRVASILTIHGESIVMRILDRENLNLNLESLGLLDKNLSDLKKLLENRDGLILITGPTGSGKTTTLYASLNFREQFGDKIITVEDPIEYEFDNFSQIPVRSDLGITFANALRAMLRQSPDTIMIGEIRDKETAQIAINASLTGHLIFSTLHANSMLSVLTRFIDLGIQPYQIASAVRGIIGQRLVRRLCENCKQSYCPSENDLSLFDLDPKQNYGFFRSHGCSHCHYTGFVGRIGLFEILPLNQTLSNLIYDGVDLEYLNDKVKSLGITTLKDSGIAKILEGLTTIEEVMAAVILN